MGKEKLSRIIGLRLLAVKEGADCGAIREVVMDVESKCVKFLVLDTGKGCFGFRVLPTGQIGGMGQDFAVTSSSEHVSDIWTTQEAIELAYTDADLVGARVVSDSGDVIGKIVDFEFNLADGIIDSYIMEDGGVLPGESIVTLSRGIVFIDSVKAPQEAIAAVEKDEDKTKVEIPAATPAAPVAATPAPVAAAPAPEEAPVAKAAPAVTPAAAPAVKAAAAPAPVVAAPVATAAPVVKPASEGNADMKDYFEKRRTEFLIGKTVRQAISDAEGKALANVGDIVDAAMIERVKAADKIIELTMGVN